MCTSMLVGGRVLCFKSNLDGSSKESTGICQISLELMLAAGRDESLRRLNERSTQGRGQIPYHAKPLRRGAWALLGVGEVSVLVDYLVAL